MANSLSFAIVYHRQIGQSRREQKKNNGLGGIQEYFRKVLKMITGLTGKAGWIILNMERYRGMHEEKERSVF